MQHFSKNVAYFLDFKEICNIALRFASPEGCLKAKCCNFFFIIEKITTSTNFDCAKPQTAQSPRLRQALHTFFEDLNYFIAAEHLVSAFHYYSSVGYAFNHILRCAQI